MGSIPGEVPTHERKAHLRHVNKVRDVVHTFFGGKIEPHKITTHKSGIPRRLKEHWRKRIDFKGVREDGYDFRVVWRNDQGKFIRPPKPGERAAIAKKISF